MKIGLIDVDGHNYPNLPLMKISAWHKARGDEVVWYDPMFTGHCDRVYMAKVFSFSPDYPYYVDADEIIGGGTGYQIWDDGQREIWEENTGSVEMRLPYEIEHTCPDYDLYKIKDTAYGFMTRGCRRMCGFCCVSEKEGNWPFIASPLNEFWHGEKNIVLMDPNFLSINEVLVKNFLELLRRTGSYIEFNQGLDVRLCSDEIIEMILELKMRQIYFAWDDPGDTEIYNALLRFREHKQHGRDRVTVYILTGYNSTLTQDLGRIYAVRDMGFRPYVMIYRKYALPPGHELKRLQRWCNSNVIFGAEPYFENYKKRGLCL